MFLCFFVFFFSFFCVFCDILVNTSSALTILHHSTSLIFHKYWRWTSLSTFYCTKKSSFISGMAVDIIKPTESCSVGSFISMLLWHCVYQIKTARLWILFWTHLHGKQVYKFNELLLAPLQLLMEAQNNHPILSQAKKQFHGQTHPLFLARPLERFTFNKSDICFGFTSYYQQPQGMHLYLLECKCKNVCLNFWRVSTFGHEASDRAKSVPITVTFV